MDSFLLALYGSKQTVFTSKEIALLVGARQADNFKSKVGYYVRTGKLIRLRRGVFVKNAQYDRKELAVRICTPAYISFETTLAREGVTFQYYKTIFVASYVSREISVNGQRIIYRKIKNAALLDRRGLVNRGTYFEATKERAFLDRLYLSKSYSFDNLRGINWAKCWELVGMYRSKRLEKTLKQYQKNYAQ